MNIRHSILIALLLSSVSLNSYSQAPDLNNPAVRQRCKEECAKRIEAEPNDFAPYLSRAYCYVHENRLPDALNDANKADQLKPNDSSIKSMLGEIHALQNNYDASSYDYTKAIALQPDSASLYNNRGVARLKLGKLVEARQDATKALQLEPENEPANELLAELEFASGKYANCIKLCNEAIKLEPNDFEAYYFRGCAYERLGNNAQASLDKNRAIKMGYTGKIVFRADEIGATIVQGMISSTRARPKLSDSFHLPTDYSLQLQNLQVANRVIDRSSRSHWV